ELDTLLAHFPSGKTLSIGVVDGRNIWRNDFTRSLAQIRQAVACLGAERLIVAPSCSLLHSPVTLEHETKLDPELKSWLAFADDKLAEVVQLARLASHGRDAGLLASNQRASEARRLSRRIHDSAVKQRLAAVQPADYERISPFAVRKPHQQVRL